LQAIKDEEIDQMREFMKENLLVLEQNQKDIDHEKKQYNLMNNRMVEEK
jgi:glycine betaine/choline ABC-type transport system substrate-binding protein